MWKVKDSEWCKASIRNKGENPFWIRIEYRNPNVYVLFFDEQTQSFQSCVRFKQELDYDGIFVLSAATAVQNPDSVFVDSFRLYNPDERSSQARNEQVHEGHKK